jgi:trimeric autotransporter adhesin
MENSGNDKFNAFLNQYSVSKLTSIPVKYNSPAAKLYKDRLQALLDGKPLPTTLPAEQSTSSKQTSTSTKSVSGSEPLTGETEEEYVARQRQLQEEARERLRQKFGSSNGLKAGGSMQGIGSDSSYRPMSSNSSSGSLSSSEVTATVVEVSQKAYSLVSSTLAVLGEQVVKAKTSYTENDGSSGSNTYKDDESKPVYKGWAALTSNAAAILQTASSVAVDTISKYIDEPGTTNSEDGMKFPRTAGELGRKDSVIAKTAISSDTYLSNTSNSSSQLPPRPPVSQPFTDRFASTPSPERFSNTSPSSSMNVPVVNEDSMMRRSPPTIVRNTSSSSDLSSRASVNSSPSTNRKSTAAQPAGDDFFATFGV